METLGEIFDAINRIDVKKENLRRSFLQLQSQSQLHSQASFNFTLKWTDLDSYFTTIRSSLTHKFHLLKTLHPSSDTATVLATPKLKAFCQNSDGLGLRRFILNTRDRLTILSKLPDAYRYAPDAAAMVLDAMEGFYRGGARARYLKISCLIMLKGLMHTKPIVTHELMDKAMLVAVQWSRERVSGPVKNRDQNSLAFLAFVGAYGLIDRFSMDELIECFAFVSKRRDCFELCRQMVPADKKSDLIQKLINKKMLVPAVKFSIEFQKTNEFSPVGLLEECKLHSERTIEEILKNVESGNVCNGLLLKEVNTLDSAIKCIDEYHLESDYPKDSLVALIKKLQNEVGTRNRAVEKKQENEVGSRKKAAIGKKQLLQSEPKPDKFHEAAAVPLPQQEPHMLQGNYHTTHAIPAGTAPYAGPIGANIGHSGSGNQSAAESCFCIP